MRNLKTPPRKVLTLMLAVLTAGTLIANAGSQPAADCSAGTREIVHLNGTTCVPASPQRIVAVGGLFVADNLFALGLKPVGASAFVGRDGYQFANYPWIAKTRFNDVQNVGPGPWSLERIVALRPDLIIAGGFDGGVYDQLSKIAPTVVVKTDFLSWRKEILAMGNVVNRYERAIAYIRAHDKRAKALRPKIKKILGNRTVTVMRFQSNGRARAFTQNSYTGSVWYDLRINFAPALATPEAIKSGVLNLGVEEVGRLDSDIMFAVTGSLNPDPEEHKKAEQLAEQVRGNPLWQTLKSVKSGQVYSLPRWTTGGGGALYATNLLNLAAYRIQKQVAPQLR